MAGDNLRETSGDAAHRLGDILDETRNGVDGNVRIGLDVIAGDGRPNSSNEKLSPSLRTSAAIEQ